MTVKQLIEHLSKLDQNLNVMCYTEDEEFNQDGRLMVLFEIEAVDTALGVRSRDQDNRPQLKFEQVPHAEKIAFLNITSDF
jgi:hypothetical protein